MILMRSPLALASLTLALIPGAAWAGDSACWIQNGVLLVPAVAAGVNGVFILDTGAAQSQLDATQASEVDITGAVATGDVRLAGRTFPGVPLQVAALDARTRSFPTPISGVLGSDILAGQVLEVRTEPCRLRISPARPGAAPGTAALPIELRAGVPFIRAGVSDGTASRIDAFRIDTGSPLPVTHPTAAGGRIRALSLGGMLFENIAAAQGDAAIGEPIWSRFSMRLDYGSKTLRLSISSSSPRLSRRPIP